MQESFGGNRPVQGFHADEPVGVLMEQLGEGGTANGFW